MAGLAVRGLAGVPCASGNRQPRPRGRRPGEREKDAVVGGARRRGKGSPRIARRDRGGEACANGRARNLGVAQGQTAWGESTVRMSIVREKLMQVVGGLALLAEIVADGLRGGPRTWLNHARDAISDTAEWIKVKRDPNLTEKRAWVLAAAEGNLEEL